MKIDRQSFQRIILKLYTQYNNSIFTFYHQLLSTKRSQKWRIEDQAISLEPRSVFFLRDGFFCMIKSEDLGV